ncbi:MAG: SUMF1/EgtB/PvdO family nonheme iron enzyme [Gammaproteobacteria bacterium]
MGSVLTQRRHCLLSFLLLVAVLLGSHASLANEPPGGDAIEHFLQWYWDRPLPHQGLPQAVIASLHPEQCGRCHPVQFEDWRNSRHSVAMGPGVYGQLVGLAPDSSDAHQACLRCHAPLAEQADHLATALAGKDDGALHMQGLVCAACHVRSGQWYGPPPRGGRAAARMDSLPHRGFVANAAFEDSRFCAACHQFDRDGFALNGKLLENTHAEWAESRYAKDGVTCQSCHMPGRRHEWRGIHDREMTAGAVSIDASLLTVQAGRARARLRIHNTGAGHYFPTYVTPAVIAEIYQENATGQAIDHTRSELVIGRKVTLNLREERFDTRIPPDGEAGLEYDAPLADDAVSLAFRVRIEPEAFYREFFQAWLKKELPEKQRRLYQRALADAENAGFYIHTSRQPLNHGVAPAIMEIPAGPFIAGSDEAEREAAYQLDEAAYQHSRTREQRWYSRERERAAAHTGAFAIAQTPVTNAQYAEFVSATGHRAPGVGEITWKSYRLAHPFARTRRFAWKDKRPPGGRSDHPVVLVSHADAQAYAAWLSRTTGAVWRLPSELEWEKAARGKDGRRFPWGDEFMADRLNSHDAGPFDTMPVGSFPAGASPFGLQDAAGQVFEWTSTSNAPGRAVVKGGSWDDKGCGVCRPAARHTRPVELKHILIGFRLVRE